MMMSLIVCTECRQDFARDLHGDDFIVRVAHDIAEIVKPRGSRKQHRIFVANPFECCQLFYGGDDTIAGVSDRMIG
jgi:hypothetical protein